MSPTYGRSTAQYENRPSYGDSQNSSGSTVIITGDSGSNFDYFTAGEQIQKNDFVYLGSDQRVYKASCTSIDTSFVVGCSNSTGSLNDTIPVFVSQGKTISSFQNLIPGKRYFLSESFGQINNSAPMNKGNSVFQVGIAKSSTEFLFLCQYLVLR